VRSDIQVWLISSILVCGNWCG